MVDGFVLLLELGFPWITLESIFICCLCGDSFLEFSQVITNQLIKARSGHFSKQSCLYILV